MKKLLLWLVTLMLVATFSLVGCKAAPEVVEPEEELAVVEEVVTEEEAPVVLSPVTLQVSGWNYDSAKVMNNIARYEAWVKSQAVPPVDVKVEWTDSGYGEFDAFVTTTYAGGSARDVLYCSDHWLAKWAEAGWVVPLEDYWSEVKDYVPGIQKFSVDAMTYNGKLYGLPYYTDVMYFVYNKKMLDEAGITAPPTTWEEVTEQSKILKEKGISNDPFQVGLAPGSWFDEAFYAMIYSEGASLFDENLQPVFETDQGKVYDMIEWMAASINDDQIMPIKVLQIAAPEVQQAFKNRDCAFVIVPGYQLLEFNTPGISEIAGCAMISMMPGETHQTSGYTRMYLLGSNAITDEATLQAALHLIEYWGGETTVDGVTDYHIAKRWAAENGLGFSINALWQDPDVNCTFSAMADTTILKKQKNMSLAKEGMSAPWFAEWISFVRAEIPKALLREQDTKTTLEKIKQQWQDLMAE